jgi:hypothetical protein
MKFFKSTRFRWPAYLAIAAAIFVAGFIFREWAHVHDVRQQFDAEWQNWQTFRTTAENVVLTSRRLMEAEAAATWVSRRAAERRHLERMETLLECVQSPPTEAPPHVTEREARIVRREIEKLRSASNSDT